jgi:hypothetical protein
MSELCVYHMKGKCKKKDKCDFIHDDTICFNFYQTGKCETKDICQKKHILKEIYSQMILGTGKESKIEKSETTKIEKKEPKSKNEKPKKKIKNTESFDPIESQKIPNLRILVSNSSKIYKRNHSTRDVILHPNLFCEEDDLSIYKNLLKEIENSKVKNIWKSWHGDSHQIANDHSKWKDDCPTFHEIIKKIEEYFGMKINATRLNLYKDSSEWKPFHHDSAAVKKEIADIQNFTVGVSFGQERDISFEHVKTKLKVSIPLLNGQTYTFSQKINTEWRHGVPQMNKKPKDDSGRISIIAWGWVDQVDQLEQYSEIIENKK